MKRFFILILLIAACTPKGDTSRTSHKQEIHSWVTNPDKSKLLYHSTLVATVPSSDTPTLMVDSSATYQTMDGFGFSLTGGSAMLINKLRDSDKKSLLQELFGKGEDGIAISYLRISIGASDLDDHVFTYDDLPKGQHDDDLSKFNMEEDRINLIPLLKDILLINPSIKIMGSPWSAPSWMKDNDSPKGGNLKREHYAVYAKYLARYIAEMKDEGIPVDAITIQNEPENPGNTPSMLMTSDEQNEFIKFHLGPLFDSKQIKTKIILFDHNCDHPKYPIAILNDPVTRLFVDGTAFHMYLGQITAMDSVHSIHPDKNIYFTEQWTSGKGDFAGDLKWHVKNLIIGAPQNWSRNVLEWNLAADEKFYPHTDSGGCTLCQGALTIDSHTGQITRNVSYYIIAHASKFVRPGARRIKSTTMNGFQNVAFQNPDGSKVLIVMNETERELSFSIIFENQRVEAVLAGGAVGTYVW